VSGQLGLGVQLRQGREAAADAGPVLAEDGSRSRVQWPPLALGPQHRGLMLRQRWGDALPGQARAGAPLAHYPDLRQGMLKLRRGGHWLKKERKNPSMPHMPLHKVGTDVARAGFHGLRALGAGTVERRGGVALCAGCGRRLHVSACSGLKCNF